MNTKLSLANFSFKQSGYGHYYVTYTSCGGRIVRSALINSMPLIDCTRNSDSPTQYNLNRLRSVVCLLSNRVRS